MKYQRKKIETLKEKLSKAAKKSGKSYAEIGRNAGVHGSQVSRICNGKFETLSENVVQVCKALKLPVEEVALSENELVERHLQAAVRRVWNGTAEGAKRLTRLLQDIAELQKNVPISQSTVRRQGSSPAKRGRAGR